MAIIKKVIAFGFKWTRAILIRTGHWEQMYPPANVLGMLIHRDWPWVERARLTINEIISANPMTLRSTSNKLIEWTYTYDK